MADAADAHREPLAARWTRRPHHPPDRRAAAGRDRPNGILGPARMPENVVQPLHRALVAAIRSEEIGSLFARDSYEPVGNTAEEFGARIRSDLATYGELVRQADIRID